MVTYGFDEDTGRMDSISGPGLPAGGVKYTWLDDGDLLDKLEYMGSSTALAPVHEAQLLTCLKLSGKEVGLLVNFNVPHLRDGIKRMVNSL